MTIITSKGVSITATSVASYKNDDTLDVTTVLVNKRGFHVVKRNLFDDTHFYKLVLVTKNRVRAMECLK